MLFRKIALARFARNLGTMMTSGVPILQSLDIVAATTGNVVLERAVRDVQDSVRSGESLAGPLTEHPVFPPMVVQMMAVGEDTGALDAMLHKIAEFYDQEVEATTEALTALIEPLMIVVIGAIIGVDDRRALHADLLAHGTIDQAEPGPPRGSCSRGRPCGRGPEAGCRCNRNRQRRSTRARPGSSLEERCKSSLSGPFDWPASWCGARPDVGTAFAGYGAPATALRAPLRGHRLVWGGAGAQRRLLSSTVPALGLGNGGLVELRQGSVPALGMNPAPRGKGPREGLGAAASSPPIDLDLCLERASPPLAPKARRAPRRRGLVAFPGRSRFLGRRAARARVLKSRLREAAIPSCVIEPQWSKGTPPRGGVAKPGDLLQVSPATGRPPPRRGRVKNQHTRAAHQDPAQEDTPCSHAAEARRRTVRAASPSSNSSSS